VIIIISHLYFKQVQIQPIVDNDKHILMDVHKETIEVHIHTKW